MTGVTRHLYPLMWQESNEKCILNILNIILWLKKFWLHRKCLCCLVWWYQKCMDYCTVWVLLRVASWIVSRTGEAQYVVGLHELLEHCEFRAYMNDALRDTFAWVKAWNCRGVFDYEITYVFRKQWMHVTYNSWTALSKCLLECYYKEVTDAATARGQITLIVVYCTVAPVAEVYNSRQDGVPGRTRVWRDVDLLHRSSSIYSHWYSQHYSRLE